MIENNNNNNYNNHDLTEPLLSSAVEEDHEDTNNNTDDAVMEEGRRSEASDNNTNTDNNTNEFSFYWNEIIEMSSLGIPLGISFFCRMGMASTDSSFVGHINDSTTSAEIYLAAVVLSDMVVSIFTCPPLAFNQVLNAVCAQSMGSGNPSMAGIWFQQSCFWLTITMLPCLIGLWYVEPILLLLDFPQEVSHIAGIYAKYNVIWPIPNGLYQCMRFYFQAQGKPKPAMYNNIVFLFVNAFLNWIFVFGGPFQKYYGWNGFGFIGAAISLSISRTMQSITYYLYMFVYKQHHKSAWPNNDTTSNQSSFLDNHTTARTLEFMKQALPNMGTLLFNVIAGQATTILVGRLGELSIAASSALSTVTIPWSGSLSATCSTISSIRVGYHLGRGDGDAAQKSTTIVLIFITLTTTIISLLFVISPNLCTNILGIATNDPDVLELSQTLVIAMLVGTYMSLMVGNVTGGVFGGMGKPLLSTLLSFGLELPMSIGGVAVYILVVKGNLLGVYWFQAISGAFELILVLSILGCSNWNQCAIDAQRRNEVRDDSGSNNISNDGENQQENNDGGNNNNDATEPLLLNSSDSNNTISSPTCSQQDLTTRTDPLSALSSFNDDEDDDNNDVFEDCESTTNV